LAKGRRATGQAPADEAVVPWFYRSLRNAAIDQFDGAALLAGLQ
jgi:DNA-directed RNA polymerase specialized sigma24 family protein